MRDWDCTSLVAIDGIKLNTRFPSTDNGRYKINLFGPVSIYRPDGKHLAINTAKHAWLIVYLATRPGHIADRQAIAGLLWPSTTDKRSQDSFRTSLRNLRKALGDDAEELVQSTNSQLLLCSDKITIDIDLVQDLINETTSEAAAQAIELVQSEIAEGLVVKEPETSEWLDKARMLIRQRLINMAERKLRELQADGHSDPLIVRYLSELCLRMDPTFDYAHFRLIEYYSITNQTPLALKHYQHCREILADQLDVEPSREIEELVARIRTESTREILDEQEDENGHFVTDRLEKPRIAVQTGAPISSTPFLGLHTLDKRLSVALSKFRTFDVSARSDVDDENLIHLNRTPPRFRLDYAIRKKELEQVVTFMMIDKLSNTVLWADTFDYPDDQDEDAIETLVSEVSNVVDGELRRGNLAFRQKMKTVYDLWLNADSLAESFQPDADLRAERILLKLIDNGAEFSRIYSTLASIQLKKRLFNPSAIKDTSILDSARRNAHHSIRMDSRDAVNYQTLGWVYYQQGNAKQGKDLFEKAYKFNSVSSVVTIACAEAFAYAGETDRALGMTEKVFRSTSTPPYFYGYLATIFFARRDYEACINMCDLGPPDSIELTVLRAAAYACTGKTALANSTTAKIMSLAFLASDKPQTVSKSEIGTWLANINMFFEPATRHLFFDGLRSGGMEFPPEHAA